MLTGQAPHLDTGQGHSDPAFYFTPHHETLRQDVGVAARMGWTSFTVGPSHGEHPVTLTYQGLDPAATYVLSVVFFTSDFKMFASERNTLRAGQTVLQNNALSVRPMRRVAWTVPLHETTGGSLRVTCTSPLTNNGVDSFKMGGCSIIAVWLEPTAPPNYA